MAHKHADTEKRAYHLDHLHRSMTALEDVITQAEDRVKRMNNTGRPKDVEQRFPAFQGRQR